MDAYLIDPFAQTVTVVDFTGDYKQIYQLIQAELFTVVPINMAGDGIFVDDEGLFVDTDEQRYFIFTNNGETQLLAGRGLVLGVDGAGESVSPHMTLDELTAMIEWPEQALAKRIADNLLGAGFQVAAFSHS
jgi:hypothetical protein